MQPQQPGYSSIRQYLELLADLPWNKSSVCASAGGGSGGEGKEGEKQAVVAHGPLDVAGARNLLDKQHFGLDRVKQRIVEYIAVRKVRRRGRQAGGQEGKWVGGPADSQACRHAHRHAGRHAGTQAGGQAGRRVAGGQAGGQACKQAGRQVGGWWGGGAGAWFVWGQAGRQAGSPALVFALSTDSSHLMMRCSSCQVQQLLLVQAGSANGLRGPRLA